MTFVIGDIHGEIVKLTALINNIKQKYKDASFIFIGDYIDKGDDASATLKYLVELKKSYNCLFLLGNHEYFWSNLKNEDEQSRLEEYLLKYGGRRTAISFQETDILRTRAIMFDRYNDFFHSLKPYTFADNYFICHSGIPPKFYNTLPADIPINEFLLNRYDFIKNQELYLGKYKVIFGHTGFYTPYVDNFKIGIDTAASFLQSQPLTAFCIDEEFFIDSNNLQIHLDIIPLNYCPNIPRVKPWRT